MKIKVQKAGSVKYILEKKQNKDKQNKVSYIL